MRHRIVSVGALLAVAAVTMLVGGRAEAKGPEYIVIGGADVAPYYYAIPDPGPIPGWLGLMPNEPGAKAGEDRPAGMVDAPPGSAILLAGAYDLYFEDLEARPGPHARYVPQGGGHPAYLYWQTPSGGMPYVAWFVLGDVASRYMDNAIHVAVEKSGSGGAGMETDWIAAFLLHDPYYTGLDGPPAVASDTYWITDHRDFSPGMMPLATVTGADASQLLDAYVATLHHWHELPPGGVAGGYKVFTPAGREVFTFVPAQGARGSQVMPAEAGGIYDAAPALDSLITRALRLPPSPASTAAGSLAETQRTRHSTGAAIMIAAITAIGFAVVLCGAVALFRRHPRVA